jgi:hypothetical protein
VIFETGKKRLFLDISSTNIYTIVPSLYQCVETRNIEIFWLVSTTPAPPFRQQRNVCHVSWPIRTGRFVETTSYFRTPLQNCETPIKFAPFISHVCAHETSQELLNGLGNAFKNVSTCLNFSLKSVKMTVVIWTPTWISAYNSRNAVLLRI